jgi:transposase
LRLHTWLQQEHAELLACKPLDLLARVLAESFTPQAGPLTPKKKLAPGTLVNPHEPQAVMARKRELKWTGYKVQIGESVPEENAAPGLGTGGFLTAVHVQVGSEGDIKGLEAIRQAEARVGLETPPQRFVDSAYVSGAQLRREKEAGGELMGPLSHAAHPAAEQGFVIAPDGRSARCPAGHANEYCRRCQKPSREAEFYRLVWKNCCQGCPRRGQCLSGKAQEKQVETRADYDRIQQRRQEQKTAAFQEQMQQRNGIEGTVSEMVRGHGIRRTRYRGLKKVALGASLAAAACNLKRWLRRMAADRTSPALAAAVRQEGATALPLAA